MTAGSTTRGIDLALTPAGTITGTVTDAATHAGLPNVLIIVSDANGKVIGTTSTVTAPSSMSGAFTVYSLPTGTYYVRTSNSLGYLDLLCHRQAVSPRWVGTYHL